MEQLELYVALLTFVFVWPSLLIGILVYRFFNWLIKLIAKDSGLFKKENEND